MAGAWPVRSRHVRDFRTLRRRAAFSCGVKGLLGVRGVGSEVEALEFTEFMKCLGFEPLVIVERP